MTKCKRAALKTLKQRAELKASLEARGERKPHHHFARCGVYFVHWRGFIKIGCAYCVVRRAKALADSIPDGDVVPLAWIPSDDYGELEMNIHKLFASTLIRGEWYRDESRLRHFIEINALAWPA